MTLRRGRQPRGFNSWHEFDQAIAEGYTPPVKTCFTCKLEKPEYSFKLDKKGVRDNCNKCLGFTKTRPNKDRNPEDLARWAARQRQHRLDHLDHTIMSDSKKGDRRRGLEGNNMTPKFVAQLIAHGCSYCGNCEGRMSIDRIDNSKAHTTNNVNAACLRCNLHRGAMPYEAWLFLVPYIRKAHELGLFGDWTGI